MSLQLTAQIPPCTGTFAPTHYIPNNQLASTFGTTLFAGTQVLIQGNYIVDANVIFRDSWVEIDPCATITIKPGSSLRIDSSCFSGNDKLGTTTVIKRWNTIRIDPGASLTVVNNSYISDADTAINSIEGGVFYIDESYLTNNWNGLRVSPYTGSHTGTSYFRNSHIIGSNALAPACNGSATISKIGIHIVDNYSVTIGDATVNALTQSIETQTDGIYFTNSSVYVLGTIFDDIDLGSATSNACIRGTSTGNGQYDANIGDGTPSPGTDCAFTNSPFGINVSGNFKFRVFNCDFNTIGFRGIWAHNFPATNFAVALVRDCEFTDCVDVNTEIVVFFEDIPITGSSGIDIINNVFNNGVNNFLGQAIHIEQINPISFANITLNEIHDKNEGIFLQNVDDAEVLSNTIDGLNNSAGGFGIKIFSGDNPSLEVNTISGTTVLSSGQAPVGIWVYEDVTNANLYCNALSNLGYNIIINNNSLQTYVIEGNSMDNGSRGIYIWDPILAVTPGSGNIGVMGSSTDASDNQWTGNLSSNNKWIYTKYIDVDAALTVFNYRNGVTNYDIAGNSTAFAGSTAIGINPLNSYSTFDCSSYGARMGEGEWVSPNWKSDDFFEELPYYYAYNHNLKRFNFLTNNSDYWTSSDSTFMENNVQSNLSKLYSIERVANEGDFSSLGTQLNNLNPENDIESAYKAFYEVLLTYRQNPDLEISEQDSVLILEIAGYCPLIYGKLISYAKAWMDLDPELTYEECDNNIGNRTVITSNLSMKAFPNPANSTNGLILEGNSGFEASILQVYDLQNRIIESRNIAKGQFSETIQLSPGFYIARLSSSTEKVVSLKVIVLQ
jgi:hypothetical protein